MPFNPMCYLIAVLKLLIAGISAVLGLIIDIQYYLNTDKAGIATLIGAIITGILLIPLIEWAKQGIRATVPS